MVEEIRSQIPLVEAEEQLLMHGLAVLTGDYPTAAIEITREAMPVPHRLPATGIPADLLAARPDIRAAAMRLAAADWRVAAARANRLPAVRLIGIASYGAGDLDLIFDNWFLQLAADLTAPVFDGGRRKAEVDLQRALADTANRALEQAIERYRRGLSDYLPVLTQILASQGLERDIVLQRTRLLEDRIFLYRALGGQWTNDIAESTISAKEPNESDGA